MRVRDLKPRNLKVPMDLLPFRPLRAIVSAMLDGATKYARDNWRHQNGATDWRETYTAALFRHVFAYNDPDESDYAVDSGIHHLAHAGACIIILLYLEGVDFMLPQSLKNVKERDKFLSELEYDRGGAFWDGWVVDNGERSMVVEIEAVILPDEQWASRFDESHESGKKGG